MKDKVEYWLTRIAVVAYGLACLLAVVCNNNAKNDMNTKKCETTCCDTQQQAGQLMWLKELQVKGEDALPSDYEVTETKPLTSEQLKVILAPENYREPGDFVAMAEYAPIAQVRYVNSKGEEVVLAFSFVSCEYKKYVSGKVVDSGLLDNSDRLSDYLESIR